MALFKISKGLKANLPSARTAGNCWYTVDDSLFYIDYEDENGDVQRKALNAKDTETLSGASLATILNSSDIEIPTSKAVLGALTEKADAEHIHGIDDVDGLSDIIQGMKNNLDDLMYVAITIPSFTIGSVTAITAGSTVVTESPIELGSTVTSVTLNWKTSKTPSAITLDGNSIDVSATSHTYNDLSLTNTKTYTLKATDERDAVATKSATLTFCNRVCYGVAESPATIDSDFVMSLATKKLATSRTNSGVKYNAGEGQYLWYCVPTRLGTCSFTDVETGLGAGLSLVATISVTNASGYSENYYVYKSDYAGLGSLTVKVS